MISCTFDFSNSRCFEPIFVSLGGSKNPGFHCISAIFFSLVQPPLADVINFMSNQIFKNVVTEELSNCVSYFNHHSWALSNMTISTEEEMDYFKQLNNFCHSVYLSSYANLQLMSSCSWHILCSQSRWHRTSSKLVPSWFFGFLRGKRRCLFTFSWMINCYECMDIRIRKAAHMNYTTLSISYSCCSVVTQLLYFRKK